MAGGLRARTRHVRSPVDLALTDAIDGYLDHVAVERGLAANTVAAYRRDLARYQRWCQARDIANLDQIEAPLVAEFSGSLRRGDDGETPLSAASAARVVVAVRNFHRFAVLEGWSEVDPAATSPRWRFPSGCPRRCRTRASSG